MIKKIPPGKPGLWRSEFKALLILGGPMALTQLVQFSINSIDVLMVGRLGPEPLAASSIGLVVFFGLFLVGIGPAMAVSPMVSQALGENKENFADVRRSVRTGLWVIAMGFPAALLIMMFTTPITLLLGQPETAARLAGPYVLALAPGLPFALGVVILRNFLAALGLTRIPLVLIIITTFFNAFMNWLLIYGNWGLPRLELVGAGIASSLSHMLGFALLVIYSRYHKNARKFEIFKRVFQIDWPRLRELVKLGWPISVTSAFEGMLFNAAILLTGRIGVEEVAAFQIALNLSALAFMVPLGLSMGGSVRVGLAAGARDWDGVLRACGATIISSALIMTMFGILVTSVPQALAGLYLELDDPANANVLALVASFLPIAGAFMMFDGVQVAANQCLRGIKDVRAPMVFTGISYWVVGFPLAAWLGLGTSLGAKGVWWGLLVSLVVASVLLGGRLLFLIKRNSATGAPPV